MNVPLYTLYIELHQARPHEGQKLSAKRIESLVLSGGCSEIARKYNYFNTIIM